MDTICRDIVDNIISYIDNELDDKTLEDMEEHMNMCSECMVFVKTYQKMLRLSGKLKETSFVTPEIRQRLKDLLREKIKEC